MRLFYYSLCLASFLSGASAFAQEVEVEATEPEIDFAIEGQQLLASGAQTYGFRMNYTDETGVYIPVRIAYSNGVSKLGAGAGWKTGEDFSKVLSYSLVVALQNLTFDSRYDMIHESDRSRLALLLEQELNFQLSKKVSLGVNLALDVFNRNKEDEVKQKYRQYGTFHWDESANAYVSPTISDREAYNFEMNSIKQRSASSLGLSLKVNIFDRKKGR